MAGAAESEASVEQLALHVSRKEVLNCALPSWYDHFKSLTFKTVFIPLSQDFVAYLNSDGLILPQGCTLPSLEQHTGSDTDDSDDEKVDWGDSEDGGEESLKPPAFPELLQQLDAAITSLGGAVVPKLNWSSPKDASWIAPSNTLMCTCPAEVLLLLKSSDFISHDLSRVLEYCSGEEDSATNLPITYTLCLRKWTHLHPSAEFRCFVYDSKIIAISQRDPSACYQHLAASHDKIRQEIVAFFHKNISGKFPNRNYVFDVYRIREGRIQLVDFNPYSPMTDALLFTWEELSHIALGRLDGESKGLPILRIVSGECAIQPSDLQSFRLPKDMVDLSTGEDIHKFVDLFKDPPQSLLISQLELGEDW